MFWYEKMKEGARGVIKVHPSSIVVFFLFCLLAGIRGSFGTKIGKGAAANVLAFLYYFLLWLTPALVLCEANFAYKKKIGKISSLKEIGKSFVYAAVTVIGAVISGIYAYLRAFRFSDLRRAAESVTTFSDFWDRIAYVYLAVCVFSALFFMYKKHGDVFEKFALRAFLGLMKAMLVYGIIFMGSFCIMWVFNSLLIPLDIEELILCLISGIVGFPAMLMALSFPGEKTSRFSGIVMGYVFPGILVAAFAIVYVYIIKILVTWTFPSNEVFTIVTALFVSGLAFWTMAQGCTEGKMGTALKLMPLFFIPFIVIQIMCLYMRVKQYGITNSRYLGILLIVFEVIYEGYYIFRMLQKESLGGILTPLLLVFVAVYFIVPKINVYAVITDSQRAVVEEFVNLKLAGNETTSQQLAKAKSAYLQIANEGGLEGKNYLKKLYAESSREEVEDILQAKTTGTGSSIEKSYFVYARDPKGVIDIEGYSHFCLVSTRGDDPEDITKVSLYESENVENLLTICDFSDIVTKLKELEKTDSTYEGRRAVLQKPIKTDKGILYIQDFQFEFSENFAENQVEDLVIEGYYIY